jgi:hypothetical protein
MIDAFEVVIDLGAERAAREGMRGIAEELFGDAVTDLHDPAAGVGTVVSASAADDVHGWLYSPTLAAIRSCHWRIALTGDVGL